MINNPDFYPTPSSLANKMVARLMRELRDIERPVILEPSAGKGDLLDKLGGDDSKYRMYAIESDPDLIATLTGKGYTVIAHDFLAYHAGYRFDGIIMNPPFAHGAKHLLHAWEILQEGVIICLLNSETLLNPYTEERKLLLKIIQDNGEAVGVGQPFSEAQRITYCNVHMVTIRKHAAADDFGFFSEASRTQEKNYSFEGDEPPTEIAVRDVVGNLITEYEHTKRMFLEYYKARHAISKYASHVVGEYSKFDEYLHEAIGSDFKYHTAASSSCDAERKAAHEYNKAYNNFVEKFKQEAWENVFRMSKFESVMTRKVRDDFAKFQKTQSGLDFTKENIEQLLFSLMTNVGDIRQACIEEVFDIFTKYHSDNRIYPEGWVTNKSWMAARKVVLPNIIEPSWSNSFHIHYGRENEVRDIDIAMCSITGQRVSDVVTIADALRNKFNANTPGNEIESTHFAPIRFFKKGTVHLTFRDEFTWKEFNLRACRMKGWLPGAAKPQGGSNENHA